MDMDKKLADNFEAVDNGNDHDQAMEDCLRNPLVVRKIFEHVSSKELLAISLVNKLWKHEARSVVRQRGSFIARLKSDSDFNQHGTCQDVVEAFLSDLHKATAVLPLSAISVDNGYYNHLCPRSAPALDPNYEVNVDQLSLKSVSVTMSGPWTDFMDCPAFLLVKKLLRQFCGVLERIVLNIYHTKEDFMEKVVQDCNFPRLKVLDVCADGWKSNVNNESYMQSLVSRAPNLKILHTDWDINSALQLLQGTSVGFVYTRQVVAPFDLIPENVIGSIKLASLKLKYTGDRFNFERFNRIAPMLLQASCSTTLRQIAMDVVLAVPLMCYGIPLENVRDFQIEIDYRRLQGIDPRILNIVKNFDFTHLFPNLNKVKIMSESTSVPRFIPERINALIVEANAVLREPALDRAACVKALYLLDRNLSSDAVQFFVEMFPSVEKLEIHATQPEPLPFGPIWNWLDLNELEVFGNLLPATGNLDSVFCGIFPEEVEELRLQDDEYLKKVNIVPIMPAITCLKNLGTLSLNDTHLRDGPLGDSDESGMFMLSNVTVLLAFARMPALAVELDVPLCAVPPGEEMTHLKPYVFIISHDLEDEYSENEEEEDAWSD